MRRIYIFLCCFCGLFASCEKYLDVKSRTSLAVPAKVQDFQALLDDHRIVHHEQTSAAEISADDYYVTYQDWLAVPSNEREMYIWGHDQIYSTGVNDWLETYRLIYRCNIVIHEMEGNKELSNNGSYNDVLGQAYFHRARAYFNGAVIWALAYDESTKDQEWGLPLRLDPDFNYVSKRSSVGQTYDQILKDLKRAANLLPMTVSTPYRSSKAAAYALLAKVYLSMRDYERAYLYADSTLSIHSELLDLNQIHSAGQKIPRLNKEIVFYSQLSTGSFRFLWQYGLKIPEALYAMYAQDDLRKIYYFSKNSDGVGFIGNYNTASFHLFSGLTTAESLLIRSECNIRLHKPMEAKADLKKLLACRIQNGDVGYIDDLPEYQLLDFILMERRKELLLRGIRWSDIKRLNLEGYGITLNRHLDEKEYVLSANSRRFALPIPEDVIALSGMEQNSY